MLEELNKTLLSLPTLLDEPEIWDSLIINRRKPHTYRIFTQVGDNRICLHKFDVCNREEAFKHPHPWPGAFKVLKGKYQMFVGHSIDLQAQPREVATFIVSAGSSYEIVSPHTWHSVIPLETTYTVMVNGPPFEYQHKEVRTTKGKDLEKMTKDELLESLEVFKALIGIVQFI